VLRVIRANSSVFSLGERSAAKISIECLIYNRDKSCKTNIHYY
jgi:hypothetical protein